MNRNIKTHTYLKTIGIMLAAWAAVMIVFFVIYFDNIKDKEEDIFLKDVNDMLPVVEDFSHSFTNESFKQVIDTVYEHQITFSIRDTEGDPIWLNNTIYFVSNDEEGNGFVTGLTNEEHITVKDRTVNLLEHDKIYSYKIDVTDTFKSNDLLVIPGQIEITAYESIDNYYDIYDVFYAQESIKYKELPDKINYEIFKPETSNTYTGTIRMFEFFKDDFRLMNTGGFSDDINRFESCTELYNSGNGIFSSQYENPSGLMEGIYTCARPITVIIDDSETDAWVIFAKTIDFWSLYKYTMIFFGVLGFIIFAMVGLIIARTTHKYALLKLREKERVNIMTNALAHDLKTPISVISSYAYLIKEKRNTEKHDYYVKKIIENSEGLDSSLYQLLKFGRISDSNYSLKREIFDIMELTKDLIDKFESKEGYEKVIISGKHKNIFADKELITRALENFVSNAFKYLKSIYDVEKGESIKSIQIKLIDSEWSIYNTGEHIKEENLEKVWDVWFMEDISISEKTGTGLGLFSAKIILDAHNFSYKVENVKNGVKFTVYFNGN